jgi:hypothetical protein
MRSNSILLALAALALAAAGCGTSATAPPAERPVAVARVEIVSLPSSFPDPAFDATCQLGGLVRLVAEGSHDPAGQALTYEWRETVDGAPAYDFGPTGTLHSDTPSLQWMLAPPGVHEIELTVTARDGRKSKAVVRVLVTGCEC